MERDNTFEPSKLLPLESERLLLKPFVKDNLNDPWLVESVLAVFAEEQVTQHLVCWQGINTLPLARQWLSERIEEDAISFWIIDKATSQIAGFCGIIPIPHQDLGHLADISPAASSPSTLSLEIAYILGRPWWGKGYATESAQLLVNHCFSFEFKKSPFVTQRPQFIHLAGAAESAHSTVAVVAFVSEAHRASIRVLSKVGMQLAYTDPEKKKHTFVLLDTTSQTKT